MRCSPDVALGSRVGSNEFRFSSPLRRRGFGSPPFPPSHLREAYVADDSKRRGRSPSCRRRAYAGDLLQ